MRTVVGIDPSLTGTSYCSIMGGEVVAYGTIDTGKLEGMERLRALKERLTAVLSTLKPDLICIEGYSFGSKGRGVYGIAEWGGVMRMLLEEHLYDWIEIPPSTLKKFATGKGTAPKETVIAHVYKRWGRMCANNNEADAFVLAKIGWALTSDEELTKYQVEALSKIKRLLEEGEGE